MALFNSTVTVPPTYARFSSPDKDSRFPFSRICKSPPTYSMPSRPARVATGKFCIWSDPQIRFTPLSGERSVSDAGSPDAVWSTRLSPMISQFTFAAPALSLTITDAPQPDDGVPQASTSAR